MIIDCHYHFEPRLLTEGQLLKKMDECGVDKVALMARCLIYSHAYCRNNCLCPSVWVRGQLK
jgi:predicted metal-dependent TIM-barrel fold hydrolase